MLFDGSEILNNHPLDGAKTLLNNGRLKTNHSLNW